MGGHANPVAKERDDGGASSSRDPEELFCLKWNDYQENVVATLSELRQEEDFFDVTLACDGEQVRAHKLVLSACSAFFRRLLRMNPGTNPIIVLWDVAFNDLINIVDFMYNGEVKVRQANIQSFLAVAEKFKVRGLCQNEGGTSAGSGRGSPAAAAAAAAAAARVSPRTRSPVPSGGSKRGYSPDNNDSSSKRPRTNEGGGENSFASEEGTSPLTPDVSIREESHYNRGSERHHGGAGGGDFIQELSESGGGAFDDRPGLQAALMGMGLLSDPNTAKEFLRRAAALGMSPAAIAAATGNPSSSTAPPSMAAGPGSQGGSSGTAGGSPLDPALRRPRSVYNSQQVAQLEAYFRFNEYIDGERKRRLSQITNIPEHQIKVWFQNRRQKKKREEAEMLQGGVPSQGGSVDLQRPPYDGKQEDEGADYAPPRGQGGFSNEMMAGNELHAGTVQDEDEEEEPPPPALAQNAMKREITDDNDNS